MPYLELTFRCRQADQPRLEAALEGLGALSVTLTDAAAETAAECAILEPGVGQTPLWPQIELSALFAHGADPDVLMAALEAFDAGLPLASATFREVADQDWERVWLDRFGPMRFGARTWIVPWNHDLPAAADTPDAAVVRLDPGLAFGSGTHPTTALCLEWLDGLDLGGKSVLDFGSGSPVPTTPGATGWRRGWRCSHPNPCRMSVIRSWWRTFSPRRSRPWPGRWRRAPHRAG